MVFCNQLDEIPESESRRRRRRPLTYLVYQVKTEFVALIRGAYDSQQLQSLTILLDFFRKPVEIPNDSEKLEAVEVF
ncbi:hypothetical protein L1987_34157 [Smallanthus sonchifolius]|uniref:Uncharacterized protein n=1 Tax=Smallanthus sonchifolius TaxID=185202 RepID=A0ACB9HU88_9ASTR|nr:hypothetical protein L1987_34157 [Smallanthus sonchifolius]